MQESSAISAFDALSQETRLRILRALVKAGTKGLSAGLISEKVDSPPSNASFHLTKLENANLVVSRREARSIIYVANFQAIAELGKFLLEDCCKG